MKIERSINTIRFVTGTDAEAEYQNALAFHRLKNFEQAIAHLNRAILKDSTVAQYWSLRADCYSQLTEYPLAFSDYQRAIELGGENGETYFKRGLLYHKLLRAACAIEDWKQAALLGYAKAIELLQRYYSITL